MQTKRITAKPRPKIRKCKVCRSDYVREKLDQQVCGYQCGLALHRTRQKAAEERRRLKARREHREQKQALKTRQQWLQEAQAAFNGYIRERDGGPCISCQRSHTGQYHAGHYRSAGAMPSLRFNTHNVHKQCSACNNHLSGNMIEYRINLIAKIGQDRVEWLESSHPLRSFDVDYLRRVKRVFAKRARHIRRLRNDG